MVAVSVYIISQNPLLPTPDQGKCWHWMYQLFIVTTASLWLSTWLRFGERSWSWFNTENVLSDFTQCEKKKLQSFWPLKCSCYLNWLHTGLCMQTLAQQINTFLNSLQKRNLASEYNPASNYAWQLNVGGKHNSVLFKLNFISNNRKTGLHIYSAHIHTAIMEHHHSKSERMTAATKVSWIHFLYPPTLNIMVQVLSHINLPVDLAALLIFVNWSLVYIHFFPVVIE